MKTEKTYKLEREAGKLKSENISIIASLNDGSNETVRAWILTSLEICDVDIDLIWRTNVPPPISKDFSEFFL